jgi:hypothetical protein
MEVLQGNPLCSYLKQAKMSFFFFYKIREQVLLGVGGFIPVGAGKEVGKGYMKLNMVQTICTHVCKWKVIPVETIPGIG